MSDKKFLVQRRQGWYVQVRVPDSLYHVVGKRKITRSLHTSDLQEARSLRWTKVKEIKAYLDDVKKQCNDQPAPNTPQGIIKSAKQVKREVDLGLHSDPQKALEGERIGLEIQLDDYLSPVGKAAIGILVDPDTGYREDVDPDMVEAFNIAESILSTGDNVVLLASEALDDHLSEITERVRVQTRNARERRIKGFLGWLGGDKRLINITKQDAGQYLTQKLMKTGRAVKTIRDTLSDLSAFFNWCVNRGMIEANPFYGLSKSVRDTSRGTKHKKETMRREFTQDELRKLLLAITEKRKPDDPLWALTLLGLLTGMRGNEIAEVEVGDVHDNYIHIPEGKTESSVRDVPIHHLIKSLVNKLKENSKDGYLLSGLKRGGEDNKRYHLIGKRFSTLLRKGAEITDKRVVFHSLRKNFSTALENAGIPESTAQQIVGHKKQSMTYGLYSKGVKMDVLSEAVQKVTYGCEVDRCIDRA